VTVNVNVDVAVAVDMEVTEDVKMTEKVGWKEAIVDLLDTIKPLRIQTLKTGDQHNLSERDKIILREIIEILVVVIIRDLVMIEVFFKNQRAPYDDRRQLERQPFPEKDFSRDRRDQFQPRGRNMYDGRGFRGFRQDNGRQRGFHMPRNRENDMRDRSPQYRYDSDRRGNWQRNMNEGRGRPQQHMSGGFRDNRDRNFGGRMGRGHFIQSRNMGGNPFNDNENRNGPQRFGDHMSRGRNWINRGQNTQRRGHYHNQQNTEWSKPEWSKPEWMQSDNRGGNPRNPSDQRNFRQNRQGRPNRPFEYKEQQPEFRQIMQWDQTEDAPSE